MEMNDLDNHQIERLNKYEAMTARVLQEREVIEIEIKELRNLKKTRTVKFKELLRKKMVNQRMVDMLEEYGII